MPRKRGDSQGGADIHLQRELYSPTFVTADPNSLCFKEWWDREVNAERWDPDDKVPQLFEDPQTVLLPPSILGHEWKRPSELFRQAEFVIYVDKPGYPDLIAGSQHLLHSEFVRSFISSVEILCYLGNSRKFSMEYTSPAYVANTADKPWRPWHHVYSRCRAGSGEKHTPTVNKSGKYIVRIFWMGCWRKVYVDDSLPLNTSNEVLLPSLVTPKIELTPVPSRSSSPADIVGERSLSRKLALKRQQSDLKKTRIRESCVIEIWPFLLAKALMKVASLTWTEDEELKDFDIIQCLTGWTPYKMHTSALDPLKLWDICMEHTSKFQLNEDRPVDTKPKKSSVKLAEDDENAFKADCYLTLCYNKANSEKRTPHSFLVDQTRDIPLVGPSIVYDFPAWKRVRWLNWAIEKEMIPPLKSTIPVRCFKIVDPFRSAYDGTVREDLDVLLTRDDEIANSGKRESRTSVKSLVSEKSKYMTRSKSKDTTNVIPDSTDDISKWIDYEQLSEHIKYLTVYYKPSKFSVKVRISNIICDNIQKDARLYPARKLEDTLLPNWKEIIIPETLQIYRNEPYRFFRDNLNSQTVIINLTQTGYQPVLEKRSEKNESEEIEKSDSECGLCSSTLLRRVMNNVKKRQQQADEKVQNIVEFPLNSDHNRPEANLVIIKYRWTEEHKDNIVDCLSTFGSRSIVLKLKPGRALFSIFQRTETSYVTQILSDGPLCVGTMEEIYPLMAEESRSLEKVAKAVAKSFEALIKSFGKPDFQEKLREYYCSYKPSGGKLDKYELKTIHESFYDELSKLVLANMGEEELRALRILFRKVQLPRGEQMSDCTLCYPVNEEEMKYVEIMDSAAIVIQSFFKGCYERSLLKRHRTTDKYYKSITGSLNSINSTLFSDKGEINLGTTLLRNFLNNDFIYDFREKYQCFEDNLNTVTIYQFPNSMKNVQKRWIILDRQVFFVSSYTPLVIRIKLFCDLVKFVVRVFDNDTGQEFKIFTNNVAVGEYSHNYSGYTMLCYGWPTSETVMFKPVFVVSKENVNFLSFPGVQMKSEVIRGNYIPNAKRLICSYQILVKSEYVLLTVYFTTDLPEVNILLRLYHQNGTLVQEEFGERAALIAAVMLKNNQEGVFKKIGYTDSLKSVSNKLSKSRMSKGSQRSKKPSEVESILPDIYFIEAYVVNDSWPLTADEWKVVEKLRERMLLGNGDNSVKGINENREYINRSPSWTMEMTYNSGDVVKFVKDERKEAEIRKTKMRWYSKDPSRYKRSQELRNNFVNENTIPNPDFCESLKERSLHPQIFHPEIVQPNDVTPFCLEPSVVKTGGKRKLKTVDSLREESTNELNRIIEFTSYQTDCLAEMDRRMEKQIAKFALLDSWYNDCRLESNLMMEWAYSLKAKYIQQVTEASAVVQKAAKNGKKEKK